MEGSLEVCRTPPLLHLLRKLEHSHDLRRISGKMIGLALHWPYTSIEKEELSQTGKCMHLTENR